MKKILLRIYRWIIISLVAQLAILLFVNNVFLAGRASGDKKLQITNYDTKGTKTEELKVITVKLPDGAANIKVSYDGAYAAYTLSGNLEIYDVKEKKLLKTLSNAYVVDQKATTAEGVLTFYKWLPDRNMIIYSIRAQSDAPGKVQLFTYDMDSEIDQAYPIISSGLSKGSEVMDIELSPQTNVVYAKIKISSTEAKIYKYNVMYELSYIMTTGINTNIKVLYYTENQLYQDDKYKISIRDGVANKTKQMPFKDKVALLGIDSDDKIYVGEIGDDGKVSKVTYGYYDEEIASSWKTTTVSKPVLPDSLIIKHDTIYEVLKDENAILDILSGSKYTFDGKLVQILDDYIVSMNNNELTLKPVKAGK